MGTAPASGSITGTMPAVAAGAVPLPAVPAGKQMDRDFVLRHQIVERYVAGRLPLKGAQDFERFCRENPQLLGELGLDERIHAALRLLEAGGRPLPWEQAPKRWWEQLPTLLGAAALVLVLALTSLILAGRLGARTHALQRLQALAATEPLDPVESTHTLTLIPSRTAPSSRAVATVGGSAAELADLKIDVSWSQYNAFRVGIDRVGQGRVAVLHNLLRDSNGDLRLAFNTSALGPGDYQLTLEGLTWRGEPVPQAWVTISLVH